MRTLIHFWSWSSLALSAANIIVAAAALAVVYRMKSLPKLTAIRVYLWYSFLGEITAVLAASVIHLGSLRYWYIRCSMSVGFCVVLLWLCWQVVDHLLSRRHAGHEEIDMRDRFPFTVPATQEVISPTGKQSAITEYGNAQLRDVASGETMFTLYVKSRAIESTAFDSSGEKIVTVSGDTITVWNTSSGKSDLSITVPGQHFNAVRFKDENRIVTRGQDGTFRVWNIAAVDRVVALWKYVMVISLLVVLTCNRIFPYYHAQKTLTFYAVCGLFLFAILFAAYITPAEDWIAGYKTVIFGLAWQIVTMSSLNIIESLWRLTAVDIVGPLASIITLAIFICAAKGKSQSVPLCVAEIG